MMAAFTILAIMKVCYAIDPGLYVAKLKIVYTTYSIAIHKHYYCQLGTYQFQNNNISSFVAQLSTLNGM